MGVTCPEVAAVGVTEILERLDGDGGAAISAFETGADGAWRIEGYFASPPDRARLVADLSALTLALDVALAPAEVTIVEPEDWLAVTRRAFPAQPVGRFFIRASSDETPVPAGRIGLCLDAATAFGSGEHPTTRSCLLALDDLAAALPAAPRILDLGCGSGILAIAAARLWPAARVLAIDIDPEAVRVTTENARQNGVGAQIEVLVADGFDGIGQAGPFDLILANILAIPLKRLSGAAAAALSPGGRIVLSGILDPQADDVAAAYRQAGLDESARIRRDGWSALRLERPGR